MEERRVVYWLQVGNTKERGHLRRGRGRWKNIIQRNLNKWPGRA